MLKFIRRGSKWWTWLGILFFCTVSRVHAAGDAAAAEQNYEYLCASCHGKDGKGNGPAAATLTPKPKNFADCQQMQSIKDDDMFAVIQQGGPARRLSSGMPAWGSALEDQEIKDLIAHIRKFCQS